MYVVCIIAFLSFEASLLQQSGEKKAQEYKLNEYFFRVFFFLILDRWKRHLERTRSASLIKTALHLPKCLKPKVSTNSQNSQTHPPHHTTNSQQNSNESAGSGSVCQSIKKSFNNVTLPHKSSFRSKSDNCLHKIHQTNQNVNNNHNFNNNPENHTNQIVDCEENGLIKKSFSQKLARAFASLVQTGNPSNTSSENNSSNQATSTSPTSIIENNVDNAHQISSKNEVRNESSDEHDRTISSKVTNNLSNAAIVKSTSLERNINCRLTQAEEQARRTRSLERNHRHLVTIDSTCR